MRTVCTLLVSLLAARPAHAAPDEPPRPNARFHADVEIDPLAYALRGYSLHVGLGLERVRLDLGAFALEVPDFLHGNKGFDAYANGFGIKLQYFFLAEQRGLFAGIDTVFGQLLVQREHSALSERRLQISVGAHIGYRFVLPAGFYVTPWVGLGYEFRADDVSLDQRTYEASALAPFATIHVGYRFF